MATTIVRPSDAYSAKLHARLAAKCPDFSRFERQRRIDATADFLNCCALARGDTTLSPSPAIDAVWHEMLMFTADYREYCQTIGAFIDHVPFDGRTETPTIAGTIDFMQSQGLLLAGVADLWPPDASARCGSDRCSGPAQL